MQLRGADGQWLHQESIRAVARFPAFTTVDWTDDAAAEQKHRRRGQGVLGVTQTWLLLGVCGVAIGTIAALLNIVTAWLAWLRLGRCNKFYLNREFCCWNDDGCAAWRPWLSGAGAYLVYVLWLAAFAATAAFLVRRYAPTAAGSGISEIKCIVGGFAMPGFLGGATLALKSLCLPLAIALGLLLGKEGPSVHYAVAVGNCVARGVGRFRRRASKGSEFLTAAAAAGVAVAFGLPVGGVLFSMEEIALRHHWPTLWKAYVCALIGVATLAALNPFRTGQLVLFEVNYNTPWHYFELPFYAVLGAFGGGYGIVVSRLNKRVAGFRKKYLANYAVREAVVLAVVLALVCYHSDFLRVDMTEAMQTLFAECGSDQESGVCDSSRPFQLVASLLVATVIRLALTIVTYGCKVPAGIFVPSMAAGATFGRAVGVVVERLHAAYPELAFFSACPEEGRCVIPGTYAFLGAGAALSGITHLTVTVAIIMFELTGALRYIVPTMVAVAVTKWINDTWGGGGIADQMIVFNGLPFLDPKEDPHFGVTVGAAMATVTTVFCQDSTYSVGDIRHVLQAAPYRGYPVVTSEKAPAIVGYILRADLEDLLGQNHDGEYHFGAGERSLAGLVNEAPLVVSISTRLEYVRDLFIRVGPHHVLVEKDMQLVGIVTRKDVLRYEHTIHELEHPHEDDGLDARVWGYFQAVGKWLRTVLTKVGLGMLARLV